MSAVTWDSVIEAGERNRNIAVACATRFGWRVLPLLSATKRPAMASARKREDKKHWYERATTDTDLIGWWWSTRSVFHSCLPGVLTGPESGIWVLDIDVKAVNGFATARDLFAAHGLDRLPDTMKVRTPSGGMHIFFQHPTDGRVIGNSAWPASKRLGPGLDSRGWHGLVVAPMTRTERGVYEVIDGTWPVAAPRWLEDLAEKRRGEPQPVHVESLGDALTVAEGVADGLSRVRSGGRNQALNVAAFQLGQLGAAGVLDESTARALLLDACVASGLLDDDGAEQCQATITSGWSAGFDTGETS